MVILLADGTTGRFISPAFLSYHAAACASIQGSTIAPRDYPMFYDPQAPWQKPTVENTNHRVRRWLPRDTILLTIEQKELLGLAQRMNATLRKCLGYRTPAEVFREELAKATSLQ